MNVETARGAVLSEANSILHGERQGSYGSPCETFDRVAARWSQILGIPVQPWQAALMMADLKLARLSNGYHHDSIVDGIGYLAIAEELRP